jgi:hypothetical protein
MRLHAKTATIENGFVWLPREAPWLAEYLRELHAVPRRPARRPGRRDRPGVLAWIKSRPRAHGMAEHWRRMAVGAVRLVRSTRKRQRAARWGGPARLGKP